MKNTLIVLTAAVLTNFAAGGAAYAADAQDVPKDVQKIEADKGALRKDDAAIEKYQDKLDSDRDAKAAAKANSQYGKQAANSVRIGSDHTVIGEKKVEKDVDTKILEHDRKELNEDSDKTADNK